MPDESSQCTIPPTAFLILAHTAPTAVQRLVGRLDAPWSFVFVHVDAKVDLGPFERALEATARCRLLRHDERVAVHWCGYSMVRATYSLLAAALREVPAIQRFCLLSGADYPVKPLHVIGSALTPRRQLIRISRQLDPLGISRFDHRVNRYFIGDHKLTNPRTGNSVARAVTLAIGERLPRKVPSQLPIFYGPSWWALTREAIEEIMAFARSHPKELAWFRWTRSPDEMVFQTLLKATGFGSEIVYDATRPGTAFPKTLHATHYVDWTCPNPDLPKTLDLSDLAAVLESPALFARKVTHERSLALLDALDQEVLGPR